MDLIIIRRSQLLVGVSFLVLACCPGVLNVLAAPTVGAWVSLGPDKIISRIFSIAIDPTTPSTLYAGTEGAGIFKSLDGAATWSPASAGLSDPSIRTLAVDPAIPALVYAGANSGLFISRDAGATWSAAAGLPRTVFNAVVCDPANSLIVYAVSTDVGVYKSIDAGGSWTAMNAGLAGTNPRTIAIQASALYLGTVQAGVFKSTTGGSSWATVNSGLNNLHVQSLAIDPTTPATIYAGTTNGGIYKTIDSGAHWTAAGLVGGLVGIGSVTAVAIDPAATNVYAATDSGIYGTQNGGVTWQLLEGVPYSNTLVIDATQPGTLYEGTGNPPSVGGTLLKSTDYGANWAYAGQGIRNVVVLALATGPGDLYASIEGGIYASPDAGASWQSLMLTPRLFDALEVDPATPTTIYAGGAGVSKTTDAGITWSNLNKGLTNSVFTLTIDLTTTSTIYAGTSSGAFKTTDGGGTWTTSSDGLPATSVFALAIDSTATATLYAGTLSGVFKSTNGGAKWSAANSGLPAGGVFALQIDSSTPPSIYAGTTAGPYRSIDGGVTWTPANTGLSSATVLGFAVARGTRAIYAGTNVGVFSSENNGATWETVGAGLTNLTINSMTFDPTGNLYVGTNGGGIFRLALQSADRETVVLPPARVGQDRKLEFRR